MTPSYDVVRAAAGVLARVPHSLPAILRAVASLDDAGLPARLCAHLLAAGLAFAFGLTGERPPRTGD